MPHRIEMFHDGDCPLCEREVRMLRRLDRKGHIRFTDIAAPGFDAGEHGMTADEFMARIKARTAEGEWLDGVDVFRALYSAVGLGWAVSATRMPGISELLDVSYDLFAKNRLRLTGRNSACSDTCAVEAATGQEPTRCPDEAASRGWSATAGSCSTIQAR